MADAKPDSEAVRQQLARLQAYRPFAKAPIRFGLLQYLVERWLNDDTVNVSEYVIAKEYFRKPDDWNPKPSEAEKRKADTIVRSNMSQIRKHLRTYFTVVAPDDPIEMMLLAGSYVPVIVRRNSLLSRLRPLPLRERQLLLRAKTMLEIRTAKSERRAFEYYQELFEGAEDKNHPRLLLFSIVFLCNAYQSNFRKDVWRAIVSNLDSLANAGIFKLHDLDSMPWECLYAVGCIKALSGRKVPDAFTCLAMAVKASNNEAMYHWWYTASCAAWMKDLHDIAIGMLYKAVHHFAATNLAIRTDLSLLLIMAKRYSEAEEVLIASQDFTSPENPLLLLHLVILYEATDNFEALEEIFGRASGIEDTHRLLPAMLYMSALRALEYARSQTAEETEKATLQQAELNLIDETEARINRLSSLDWSQLNHALFAIGKKDYDGAVEHLRKAAFEEMDPYVMWFQIFPPFRHLRTHKGYQELIHQIFDD